MYGRERVDHYGVGPGVETTRVQSRSRSAGQNSGRIQAGAGTDHHRVGPGRVVVKVARVLEDLEKVEHDLAQELVRFAERHAAEHDLYHTGHTLARQSEQLLQRVVPFASRYSASPPNTGVRTPGLLERAR